MLCGSVAECVGMACVLCAVLSETHRVSHTQHSTQYARTVPYLDMLPHHCVTYNDVTFY
jgi:hypothetical protein